MKGTIHMNIFDRIWCWIHYVCPKHLVVHDWTYDGFYHKSYCPECVKEKREGERRCYERANKKLSRLRAERKGS